MSAARELELALQAGTTFDLKEVNAEIATGIVDAGAGGVAACSRALGTRRGLELWHHLHAQRKGAARELIQRTAAELLSPGRAASIAEFQAARTL